MQPRSQRLLLLIILLCFSFYSKAQSFAIKGNVSDTLNNVSLQHASITLIRAEDSVLVTFARTNEKGDFSLHPGTTGKFIIMISFPSFAEYVDIVKLSNEKPEINMGNIPMVSKTHLLEEFVLKQQIAAIKVKGDTTEYMADSFKVKDNASVEDLLKKLPGLQVDKNGQVTAQGEKVEKILVDGEEFFSDDPAVVTKSLQANIVEKVQVFDKKSDQAEFTGIDDGQKTKTINLQLKENKKKGYFGKVSAGGGTDQYFENQGMLNAFKGKRQFSVFGIVSNTDKIGLGWQDRNKYAESEDNTVVTDDGSIMTTFTSSDDFSSWDGTYSGQGLPKVWTTGAHFADKWGDADKYHVTGNYRYAKQNVETGGDMITEYTIPGSRYFTDEHRNLFSSGQRHGADGLFEWKLDSTSSLKLTVNGGYSETQNNNSYETEAISNEQDTSYRSNRQLNSDASSKNVNATLLYRKKFAKKGRSLSVSLTENYKESNSTGYLHSLTHFYTTGQDSLVDQRKVNDAQNLVFKGRINYTEPLSKVSFVELNYALGVNNSNAEKNSYDRQSTGEYTDSLNPMYSSNYRFNILQNSGGAAFRFVYKKVNFSFGGDISNTTYKQLNLGTDTVYHRSYEYSYNNFFPRVNFSYKPNKQASVNFSYMGSSRQPTIEQIQPLRDNTDPLNIPVGNPGLGQQFNHTFSVRYNFYKVLDNEYLWSSANYSFINNAISRSDFVNSDGSRTYQYVNVQGNYTASAYLGYNFKVKAVRLGARLHTNINHSKNFVNGVENISNNNLYGIDFDLNYDIENKLSIYFTPGISYNDNKASISTYTTSYWSTGNDLTITYQLPKKIELSTMITWYMREKTPGFDQNNSVVRWNAYVSKKLLKKDQLEVRASVFDILNQNIGFTRYAQNNYVTQDSYNTIRRYGMLSVIWNFTHSPMAANSETSTK